jgi:hypothetical protein
MIGEIVQHILDKGFFVRFIYGDSGNRYDFKVWKYYENDICQCAWAIDDFMVSQGIPKDVLTIEADRYLKQVDDAIAQRRLVDSALK